MAFLVQGGFSSLRLSDEIIEILYWQNHEKIGSYDLLTGTLHSDQGCFALSSKAPSTSSVTHLNTQVHPHTHLNTLAHITYNN